MFNNIRRWIRGNLELHGEVGPRGFAPALWPMPMAAALRASALVGQLVEFFRAARRFLPVASDAILSSPK